MRTFFCCPVDDETRGRLARLAGETRAATAARASWVAAGNYHVTVRFLGEIDPRLTIDLKALAQEVASVGPFSFALDRLSAFPSEERPRVIWAGGDAPAPFRELCRLLGEGLEGLGFRRDRRQETFHITLARLKGPGDTPLRDRLTALEDGGWRSAARRLVLMESRLTRHGAVYTEAFSVPLRGRAA